MARRVVIVGGGIAGATAATTLRSLGFEGDIELLGAETAHPYHRPPLSKSYLRGEVPMAPEAVEPPRSYVELGIEVRLGVSVTAIEPARKTVRLASGAVSYDHLLVATGARNRTLGVPGGGLPGVFQLRTVEDADRIRDAARAGRRAVVVGLGFVGCEVAASLRQLGLAVTAIEGYRFPLGRTLGPDVGKILADVHRDRGVGLLLEDSVAEFEGRGRVERVRTKRGRLLECDLVVVGVGVQPNSDLLAAAGAAVDNGVLVDAGCRTSIPDVYAAGDVANHLHPLFGRTRVDHWNTARGHGSTVARAITGDTRPHDDVPSFWSEQYEHLVEYVGFATRWDQLVVRGRLDDRTFLGLYLRDGVVRAAIGMGPTRDAAAENARGDMKIAAQLIRARARIDPSRLADERFDLRDLELDDRPARSLVPARIGCAVPAPG